MSWFFFEGTLADREAIRRGDPVSEPENTTAVASASVAMHELGIGPAEGERFQTMLKAGEVSFAGIDASDLPIIATRHENSYPNLRLLGKR